MRSVDSESLSFMTTDKLDYVTSPSTVDMQTMPCNRRHTMEEGEGGYPPAAAEGSHMPFQALKIKSFYGLS